jgi:hypothetical protein
MTKQEFVLQLRSRDRQYVIRGWIALLLIVTGLGAAAFLEHLAFHEGLNKVCYGLLAGLLLIGTVALICWGEPRGVPCPHCRKRLFGVVAQIAVATGNCGFCGEEVFEQPVSNTTLS